VPRADFPGRRRGRTPPEEPEEELPAPGFGESQNLHFATAILWTLNLDTTPIYALRPAGPFARETYIALLECFHDQVNSYDTINPNSERVSVPGILDGNVTLLSGQTVPVLVPDLRGLFSWTTGALVTAVLSALRGKPPYKNEEIEEETAQGVRNFLNRIYYDLQNTGQTPQERALNFAATKAFLLGGIMEKKAKANYQLDEVAVERSTVCRPDSDCWDVRLTFFSVKDPLAARQTLKFTLDVSYLIPVSVGEVREWSMR
jgi:cyanobactin maturation PatA/PatG family protease